MTLASDALGEGRARAQQSRRPAQQRYDDAEKN
jgi:hypothetical protein